MMGPLPRLRSVQLRLGPLHLPDRQPPARPYDARLQLIHRLRLPRHCRRSSPGQPRHRSRPQPLLRLSLGHRLLPLCRRYPRPHQPPQCSQIVANRHHRVGWLILFRPETRSIPWPGEPMSASLICRGPIVCGRYAPATGFFCPITRHHPRQPVRGTLPGVRAPRQRARLPRSTPTSLLLHPMRLTNKQVLKKSSLAFLVGISDPVRLVFAPNFEDRKVPFFSCKETERTPILPQSFPQIYRLVFMIWSLPIRTIEPG